MKRQPIKLLQKLCGVYSITCIPINKVYIGSSISVTTRWKSHISHLLKGTHENFSLQKAWNDYGEKNFNFSILEECAPEVRIEREQYYMDLYDACNSEKGFNIAQIAGLPVSTPESRKKQSESLKRNTAFIEKSREFMKALHNDPIQQQKLIESVKNSEKVKETLRKLNASPEHKKQVQELLNKIHNDPRIQEHVKGLAQKNIRNKQWMKAHNQKVIVQLTQNWEYVTEYISLHAAKRTGLITRSILKRIVTDSPGELHHDYRWIYKDDYEKLQRGD